MTTAAQLDLKQFIREIPDFPKPGILFRDITPLLAQPHAFREVIRRLADQFRDRGVNVIAAAEARGFIFAGPLALELDAGFVPIRKRGKLPFRTHAYEYELEYGSDRLEMHSDGILAGQRVLLVDDLLATSGTIGACCKLVEQTGAKVVACAFVIELAGLQGAQRIAPHEVFSVLQYD